MPYLQLIALAGTLAERTEGDERAELIQLTERLRKWRLREEPAPP